MLLSYRAMNGMIFTQSFRSLGQVHAHKGTTGIANEDDIVHLAASEITAQPDAERGNHCR